MQRPGTQWTQEPRPLAPPLGRPPPPPPPTRPLAPPLCQNPPPPPPPPPRLPSTHPPPSLSTPPLLPPPSSSLSSPPLPPPPTNEPPPLPPSDREDTNTPKPPTPKEPVPSERRSSTEKSPTSDRKYFGGMKTVSGGNLLGKRPPGSTISLKLGGTKMAPAAKKSKPVVQKPALVSQMFGDESDEEEEMPPEAKLRMRNVGKDTPTSSGPNSFYKGRMGFSDPRAGYKRYNDDD